MDNVEADRNSKRTRVEPVFGWLKQHGGPDWPDALLGLADGLSPDRSAGTVSDVHCEDEKTAAPTPARLAWMIRNAHRLTPRDGRPYGECARRVLTHPERDKTLRRLDAGETEGIPAQLKLEGNSYCDCLIEWNMR